MPYITSSSHFRFGNSVVALDARTGKYIWHFQTVHHDLWDYDLPAPPNLITVTHGGKKIDAVAQTTKTGFLFLLDRETGTPLFPVDERRVPASTLPGDAAWPTGDPITGAEGYGGPIVTSGGLVFIGSTHDRKFRAYDKDNGQLLWETTLPGVANATPCTYWHNGRQFIAVSVSGTEDNPSGYIICYSLPPK